MPNRCPECGAVLAEDVSCQSIFDSFLALEYTDPEYGQVHMLTVACFMIQHGRYSDEALAWIERKLRANLEGIPAEQIRRQAAKETAQGAHTWRVTRQPDKPQMQVDWSMTIGDIAANYHDAGSFRELVKRWAEVTLREMQTLLGATELRA